ncbi:MAG: c-type cytochrome [Gemmatimonadales bacterium]
MANRWGRRLGIALGTVVGLILLLAGATWVLSSRAIARRYAVTPEAVTVPNDSASIARGRHLASTIGKCTDCHGDNLAGRQLAMGPVGTFVPLNLTSGKGGVAPLSDDDWVRAIRHGVAPDGRSLLFMPSMLYQGFSAADLGAVIAYVKSVPPVDNELPRSVVGPIGRILIAKSPHRLIAASVVDHAAPLSEAIPAGPSVEYGRYLTVVGGCVYCHGDDLKGGIKEGPPGTPVSIDLTATGPLEHWTEEDFRKALRVGLRPDGSAIDPFMPWRFTRDMTDEEITAVWAYLRTK